jgi:hypothetical protein
MQAGARFVTRTRLHSTVDRAHAEAPGPQAVNQIVERVLKFREEQQPLLLVIEEPLVAK